MNPVLMSSFLRELEKRSYDVRKLRGAWSRIGGVGKRVPGGATQVRPTARQYRLQTGRKPKGWTPGAIKRAPILEYKNLLEDWTGQSLSPQAARAADNLAGIHESTERKLMSGLSASQEKRVLRASRPLQERFGHNSPQVMAQDFNLYQKAEIPKGLDEIETLLAEQELRGIRATQAQRDISGQTEFIKNLYIKNLGPSAAAFFEPGAKIPKTAIRRVNQIIADRGTLFPQGGARAAARAPARVRNPERQQRIQALRARIK